MTNDLRIQTKTYELLQWLLPKAQSFPRSYRATVTQRMLDSALNAHEAINAAVSFQGRRRQSKLHEADAALVCLRSYLRLVFEWHWLNSGQYEHVSRIVAEIGRMLGSWLKQVVQR